MRELCRSVFRFTLPALLVVMLFSCAAIAQEGEETHVVILATSDMHGDVWGYSYEDNAPTDNSGMSRLYICSYRLPRTSWVVVWILVFSVNKVCSYGKQVPLFFKLLEVFGIYQYILMIARKYSSVFTRLTLLPYDSASKILSSKNSICLYPQISHFAIVNGNPNTTVF